MNQVGYLTDSPVKVAYLGRWMGSFPEKKAAAAAEAKAAPQAFWEQLDKPQAQGEPQQPAAASPSLSFPQPPEFQICSEKDGAVVFTGPSKLVHRSGEMNEGYHKVDHSGENVYLLDFTELSKRPDGTSSASRRSAAASRSTIGDDAYKQAFEIQAYGVFAQRCGIELRPAVLGVAPHRLSQERASR